MYFKKSWKSYSISFGVTPGHQKQDDIKGWTKLEEGLITFSLKLYANEKQH